MSLTPGAAPRLSVRDPQFQLTFAPLDTAWHLHRAWPISTLAVLDDAGHGGGSFTSQIIGALDSFHTQS